MYKKDNYLRHWDNFLDIINDDHAPVIKYSRAFIKGYLAGMIFRCINWYGMRRDASLPLSAHKIQTSIDLTRKIAMVEHIRFLAKSHHGYSIGTAFLFTYFTLIFNKLQDWGYSVGQASLRAWAGICPLYLIAKYDRIGTNFGYRWGGMVFCGCKLLFF